MSTDNMHQLSLMKMKFIEQIVAEQSLDTLHAWYNMYEEAKYVASLDSEEEELKEFRANYEESLRKGVCCRRKDNL